MSEPDPTGGDAPRGDVPGTAEDTPLTTDDEAQRDDAVADPDTEAS